MCFSMNTVHIRVKAGMVKRNSGVYLDKSTTGRVPSADGTTGCDLSTADSGSEASVKVQATQISLNPEARPLQRGSLQWAVVLWDPLLAAGPGFLPPPGRGAERPPL